MSRLTRLGEPLCFWIMPLAVRLFSLASSPRSSKSRSLS